MNTNEPNIHIGDILYSLLDNILYIIIAALLGGVVTAVMSHPVTTTTYSATSKIYLAYTDESSSNYQNITVANNLIGDCIASFSNTELHEMVGESLKLQYAPIQLMSMVSVSNTLDTHILNITVTSSNSAEEAQLIANTYAETAGEFFDEKFNFTKTAIFEYAPLPQARSYTLGKVDPFLGVFAGILIACAIIVIRSMTDDRIRVPMDIEECFGIEVLGIMTAHKQFYKTGKIKNEDHC